MYKSMYKNWSLSPLVQRFGPDRRYDSWCPLLFFELMVAHLEHEKETANQLVLDWGDEVKCGDRCSACRLKEVPRGDQQ